MASFSDTAFALISMCFLFACLEIEESTPLSHFNNAGVPLEADPMTLYYYYKVGCKSWGVGDKNPQKRREIFGSASTPDRT